MNGNTRVTRRTQERLPWPHPFWYRLVVFATGVPIRLGGLRVEGRLNVPRRGPLIIAGNHEHALDPFAIAQRLPGGLRVQFMAKQELFAPPLGWVIRRGGTFPVSRGRGDIAAFRTALGILRRGGVLGIFPGGRRGATGLQAGAATLALKSRTPLLPAAVYRDGRGWVVRYGPPIAPHGKPEELTARLAAAIAALRGESPTD